MSEELKVNTEYQGYIFLGWAQGNFEPKTSGDKRPYYNMYVFSPVNTFSSDDYHAFGFKTEKKSCLSPNVWTGLNPGDQVKLFFDDKPGVTDLLAHVVLIKSLEML